MAMSVKSAEIVYPESDGQPMAENTKQFRYITTIEGGMEALFREEPQVFVAGDLFWYPVQDHPEICQAPDIFVAFGRPKGDRGSYKQWEEDDIAPQVVFEVRSPSDTNGKMARKLRFYDRYGVHEYYVYDPERGTLCGWRRQGQKLTAIDQMAGWVSPLLGVRFTLWQGELRLFRPDGEIFATYLELSEQREQERQRAEQAHQRAETLAARLRALGIDPEQG
jgi:Uma2 family endonuclease